MKLIPVDAIPKVSGYHKLQELIEEFVNGDADGLPVLFGCGHQAVKAFGQGMETWKRSVSKQGYLTKIEPCDSGSFFYPDRYF